MTLSAESDAERRRRSILRLAAAAALETHADYTPLDAWRIAGQLPETIQIELRDAAAGPISTHARREVAERICKSGADGDAWRGVRCRG